MKPITVLLVLIVTVQLLACQIANLVASPPPTPTATRTRTPTVVVRPPTLPPPPPPVQPTVPPAPAQVEATATENVRIRANPSTSAAVLGRLNKGETAQIVGKDQAGAWWQILLPSNPTARGWISAEFAAPAGPTEGIPVAGTGPQPPAPRTYP